MNAERIERVVSACLAISLLAFGGAKIAWGYRDGIEIGQVTYYVATVIELGAAVLLLSRRRLLGAALTSLFCAAALGHSWLTGVQDCGCLGPITLSASGYRMVAATLGLVATMVVYRQLSRLSGTAVRPRS
jgi:hypothetical protein